MRGNVVVRWAWTMGAVMLTASMVSQAFVTDLLPQDADGRSAAIRALIDEGRFADAEAEARRLFPAFSKERIEAPFDVRAGDLLVAALVRNGRGAEPRTRELAEEIVRAKQSDDPSLPTSLRNLGDVLFQAGEYQLATARFRESVAIRERPPGAQPSDVADVLDRLVRALTESDHYDEASALAKRAMALREQQTNPSDVRMARTLQ